MVLSETLKDWLGTFWRILILPTPKTFVEEAEKAKDKFTSVIGWAVFIIIYSYLIAAMAGYMFNFTILISGSLILPIVIVLIPSAIHFVLQRVFHRKQYLYDKVLYIFTSIVVLFQIIITPIIFWAPQSIASVISYIVIAYQFILFVISIKSIANIKYWQATITVIVSLIIGGLIFICVIPFITSLMGGVSGTLG
jgi:hypothetical protein